jgi:hypothetical protein
MKEKGIKNKMRNNKREGVQRRGKWKM